MFEASGMLFLYCETSLHAGTGRGFGAVDLPIQRERTTDYPFIQAGGIKGRLRAAAEGVLNKDDLYTVYGPEANSAQEHAGALIINDAHLALLPVRSLAGVFAYVTSMDVLARLKRAATVVGVPLNWELPETQPSETEAWINGNRLTGKENEVILNEVILEEFSFTANRGQAQLVETIGRWFAKNALLDPETHSEYAYFAQLLPESLCIVSNEAFRDFARYATEVQTHIHLDASKKTVIKGQLWTAESLPFDSLLYVPVLATRPRRVNSNITNAESVLSKLETHVTDYPRLNFGGDETTGQGMIAMRYQKGQ